jgi:hypothetical protein
MFLTFNAGLFFGALPSGWTIHFFTSPEALHWRAFWPSSSAALVVFAIFFRSRERVETA